MNPIQSFPPLAAPDARLLILGSMPGAASLKAGQYYAHPQNLFWRFLGETLGFDAKAPYEARCAALLARRIAVWDVLASCHRPGSLDADIVRNSIVSNDLRGFLDEHAQIELICFNGALAEKEFRLHIWPDLISGRRLDLLRLPSTSPANASIALAQKRQVWHDAILSTLAPMD